MAQDNLKIGLEHHRAGRLLEARAKYQAVLMDDPGDPDAMHWLGVLYLQAGNLKEAIVLLEQASAIRPGDAAFAHNLGQAYLQSGQMDAAITAFERAAAEPLQSEVVGALANAYLQRRRDGDAELALAALARGQAVGVENLQHRQTHVLALVAAGRANEAVAEAQKNIERDLATAENYYCLALAYYAAGQAADARKTLNKTLEIQPGFAAGWRGLATLTADEGRFPEAAAMFRRAIQADRNDAAAYQGLGRVLHEMGQRDQAMAALRDAVRAARGQTRKAVAGSVAELEKRLAPTHKESRFHYALAAMTNFFPPPAVPGDAIAGLFNKYASYFDEHLVDRLDYHVPEMLARVVAAAWDERPMDVLDLGCGTGLCGPLLKPMAKSLWGVDLSPQMLEKARERGVYDRLENVDLVGTMQAYTRSFDLLAAADVLIYIGDLSPVFAAAAKALRPGGLFAYSVEGCGGDRFVMDAPKRRYRHSQPYIQKLAAMYGLEEKSFDTIVVRMESMKPVIGFLVVLGLPSEGNIQEKK